MATTSPSRFTSGEPLFPWAPGTLVFISENSPGLADESSSSGPPTPITSRCRPAVINQFPTSPGWPTCTRWSPVEAEPDATGIGSKERIGRQHRDVGTEQVRHAQDFPLEGRPVRQPAPEVPSGAHVFDVVTVRHDEIGFDEPAGRLSSRPVAIVHVEEHDAVADRQPGFLGAIRTSAG